MYMHTTTLRSRFNSNNTANTAVATTTGVLTTAAGGTTPPPYTTTTRTQQQLFAATPGEDAGTTMMMTTTAHGGAGGAGFSGGDALRDRTGEFRAAVERFARSSGITGVTSTSGGGGNGHLGHNGAAGGGGGAGDSAAGTGNSRATQSQREFAQRASRVGMSIHATSQKLARLAQLAKRTSMFDDPSQQIAELTAVIKQDITAMQAEIDSLQAVVAPGAGNRQSSEHSTSVVANLKGRLMDTTKEFKDVLTKRTDSLKVHESRQANMFAAPTGPAGMRARRTGAGGTGSPAAAAGGGGGGMAGSFGESGGIGGASSPKLFSHAARVAQYQQQQGQAVLDVATLEHQDQQQQQQQQQQLMVRRDDMYMSSRAEALQNVESTISELGGMFQQLATMVQQQQEVAIRIDQDVEETMTNVDGAQAQLLKYLDRISGNRWLVLKIFMVLMAFMTVFVLFVA